MITGFNTDIKHGEKVFHVQTEDRGTGNPVVESLVYVGGEILLSKKSPYPEHIKDSQVDEKAVKEMMDLQHRRIIEAIRRGRFDGTKPGELSPLEPEVIAGAGPAPEPVSAAAAAAAAAMLSGASGSFQPARPAATSQPPAPRPALPPRPALHLPRPSGVIPNPLAVPPPGPPSSSGAPAVKAPVTGPVGRPSPPSSGSIPGVSNERSLDQVIIDYLASEAASEHLELSVMAGGELLSGEPVALSIRASTSLTEKPVAGAHISVRVVSTVGPPQIVFRGVTGSDGLVKATCIIPDIGAANAALIIAASSSLGNNEIKQLIRRKAR
ncbi:MAG: hypothetical protein ABIT01_00435 [Thermoanaerobaculia bacterium]